MSGKTGLFNVLNRARFLRIFAGVLLSIVAYRKFRTTQVARQIALPSNTGIQVSEAITLGGVKQHIYIRGHDVKNPVLLFIHGGPGLGLMPFHHLNANIERHFTVVHWDQRGTGQSYQLSIQPSSMTPAIIYRDACQLIQYLRWRFQQSQIYLAGHSLGTVTGMMLAYRHPEWFYAYMGIAQVVDKTVAEGLGYRYVLEIARRRQDEKALHELKSIKYPPYQHHRDMLIQRKWVRRYGGNLFGRKNSHFLYHLVFESPYLSWGGMIRYVQGIFFSLKNLWAQFNGINFFKAITAVSVPVYFLEGRYDYVAPSMIVETYCRNLASSSGKTLIWFEQSAHWPHLEEPERFYDVLVNQVLPETYPRVTLPHQAA